MIEVAIIQIHTANTGTPPSTLPTLCQLPAAPCAEEAMMPAAVSSTPPIRPSHVSHRGKRRDSNIARDAVTTETPIGPKISLSVIDRPHRPRGGTGRRARRRRRSAAAAAPLVVGIPPDRVAARRRGLGHD